MKADSSGRLVGSFPCFLPVRNYAEPVNFLPMTIRGGPCRVAGMRAYVFLVTKSGTSEEVLKYLNKIAKVKGVTQVDSVYGRFDAIVAVEAPDMESLGDLIYKVIEKVPNVIHTETALALSHKA